MNMEQKCYQKVEILYQSSLKACVPVYKCEYSVWKQDTDVFFNCIGMWWIDANLLHMNWRVNVGTSGLVWNIAALFRTMIHAYTHWEPNVGHVLIRVTFPVYTSDTEHWLLILSLFWADLWASALESVFRQVSFTVFVCLKDALSNDI